MIQLDAKSVVVGVNGSKAAVNAAKWAIDEALSRQMPLRLVYAIPRQGAQTGAPTSEWQLERAEMALSQAECAVLSVAKTEGKPVEVETAILSGEPQQVLITESEAAALVCVGTSRRGWETDGLLGATAAALVKGAHCPVAIIRTNPDGSPTKLGVITVVLDDDPDNDEVVHQAMEEARRRHATVRQIDRGWTAGSAAIRTYPFRLLPRAPARKPLRTTAAQPIWPLWARPRPMSSQGSLPRTVIRFWAIPTARCFWSGTESGQTHFALRIMA